MKRTPAGRITRAARAAAVLVASMALGQRAGAQHLAGTVRDGATAGPVTGAVVLILDSAGQPLARTISGGDGRYALDVAPGGRRVRAIRIGYRPVTMQFVPRVDTTIEIVMERVPVLLDAVHVSSAPACDGSASTRAALELWEQARSGLLAAIVAREAKPAQVSTLTYERQSEPRGGRITQQRTSLSTGVSKRPFVARPADLLARNGYASGQGGQQEYFAPDADVLFDDSFLTTHCFGVRVGDRARPGQIGMTFTPRPRDVGDSTVDVQGVLWLEPKGPSLVELEYRYAGINAVAIQAGAGGRVHFQSVANGITFVDEWSITLPVITNIASRRFSDTVYTPILKNVSESGGIVSTAHWDDGTTWTTRSIASITGQVVGRGTHVPAAGVVVAISGMTETVTDTDGHFSFGYLPRGRYRIDLTDSTFGAFLKPRTSNRDVDVTPGDSVRVDLEVAPRSSLIGSLCRHVQPDRMVVLGQIGDGTGAWPKDLRIESSWQNDFTKAGSGVAVSEGGESIDVDDAGRFHACGAVRERPVRLRALIGKVALADTVLRASSDTVRTITWAVRPGAFTAAQLGDGSAFAGQVVRATDGSPVADAEVALLPTDERSRTDSAGRFTILGLPSGKQLIEVRRIGYAAVHDTVTLQPREETVRTFSLAPQVVALDTIRTKGDYVKYISPALQGFEARRSQGFGNFISESDLRKNDDRGSITALLSMRIPGTHLVPYGSAMFLTSSRGMKDFSAIPSDPKSPKGCWVDVILDGVAIYRGGRDDAPDMSRMQANQFAGIEYYSGLATVPPQFIAPQQTGCGVLLLWTRER